AVDVVDEQGRTAYVGPPWSVAAVADMNGDGQNDIIWHNSETNETQIWMMNGHQITGRPNVVDESGSQMVIGLPWSITGTADMNGDGRGDIVWHNAQTGQTHIWFMNGYQIAGRPNVTDEAGN